MIRWAGGEPTPETPINRLKIGDREYLALERAGYRVLSEVLPLDGERQRELVRLPNFGGRQLKKLLAVVSSLKLD